MVDIVLETRRIGSSPFSDSVLTFGRSSPWFCYSDTDLDPIEIGLTFMSKIVVLGPPSKPGEKTLFLSLLVRTIVV